MTKIFNLDEIIIRALEEDIGNGDITTIATVSEDTRTEGYFIAKEQGVICGLPILKRVYEILDSSINLRLNIKEGESVDKGTVIAVISGNARGILTGERVALNFLQRLSGIATRTREASLQIEGTKAVITDTRKTTPGLRSTEKYAVRIGGGSNHRFNLADGILIKDNHIKAAGGITQAIAKTRQYASHLMKIEVEVETFEQIDEALQAKADVIMLDNMSIEDMKKAVALIDGRALVEASGNMGEKDLRSVAETGVDIISIGALTHSIRAMDISLRFR
ncbi:MAG: carboxylating nicotinate-nucleotide diphosphorylase [Saccharofermentanales bacterium]